MECNNLTNEELLEQFQECSERLLVANSHRTHGQVQQEMNELRDVILSRMINDR